MDVKDAAAVPVQSVGRALTLLEAVAEAGEVGVSELSASSGWPTSTVHNLLKTLSQRGYVVSTRGRYRLGPAVMVLSSQLDPSRTLTAEIQPSLERISRTTGHSATATTLVGRRARAVSHSQGTGEITVRPAASTWQHPLALATGRVLVALDRHLDRTGFVDDARDVEPGWSVERWQQELTRIAVTGVAVRRRPSTPEHPPQVTAVAVPVWVSPDLAPYALGVSVPWTLDHAGVADLVEVLWRETEQLSAVLGCPEPPLPRPSPAAIQQASST